MAEDPNKDDFLEEARRAEAEKKKKAEAKRKADKARAKRLRDAAGAVARGPKNLGEATERAFGAVATGFGNQIKSDEAVRSAQRAEEKARQAASAYASNPTDANRSKYQAAKSGYDKATADYKKVTGKSWAKSADTEAKATGVQAMGAAPVGKDNTTPKPSLTTGNAIADAMAKAGVNYVAPGTIGSTAVAPVKPTFKPSGDPETDRENRRAYNAAMDAYDKKLATYNAQIKGGANGSGGGGSSGGGGGGGGGGYSGPTTSVSRSITQYTAQQVKGFANQAFQEALGREASAAELSKFVKALNKAEKANPTKTVTTSNASGSTSTSKSTTSGGIDEKQLVEDEARKNAEYAPYQQATTYFDAMLGALNGTVGRGI